MGRLTLVGGSAKVAGKRELDGATAVFWLLRQRVKI
jgi:hypothetical protein